MRYRVRAMLRIERLFEEAGIRDELDADNPRVPDGTNWKASFMIEIPDVNERRAMLARVVGIDNKGWLRAGDPD